MTAFSTSTVEICSRISIPIASHKLFHQRIAYFSVSVAGLLSILTGWAIHKPMQLHWLTAMFGGYDKARISHFWLMWMFVLFVVPHVILVLADGWDTLRSMIVGWSTKTERSEGL